MYEGENVYFSEEFISEVIKQNDIVSVVSSYVKLKRVGTKFVGLCPFHNERTASFSVSFEKQLFYCFGCLTGGTVVTFIMKKENLNFPEAIKFLADRVSLEIPENDKNYKKETVSLYEKKTNDLQYKQRSFNVFFKKFKRI